MSKPKVRTTRITVICGVSHLSEKKDRPISLQGWSTSSKEYQGGPNTGQKSSKQPLEGSHCQQDDQDYCVSSFKVPPDGKKHLHDTRRCLATWL